jgi:hypothetical protein
VNQQQAQRCASAWWKLLQSPASSAAMLQPDSHTFLVDPSTKCVAPLHASAPPAPPPTAAPSCSTTSDAATALAWPSNCVPLCYNCRRLARPSVVMFGDSDALVLSLAQRRRQRYQEWEAAVERQVEWCAGAFRVVILEMGCGTRVRSISDEAQCVHDDINAICRRLGAAPAATLVRVNPDAGCASSVDGSVVSIRGGAEQVRGGARFCFLCNSSFGKVSAADCIGYEPILPCNHLQQVLVQLFEKVDAMRLSQ